jgi:AcrR family transcriptional regulator
VSDHGAVGSTGTAPSTGDRIIHAALVLISEQGLGGVTMSGVADAAGVARQTLYNHYPDVDSIVAAAISQHARESVELLDAAMRVVEGPLDKLGQLIRHVAATTAHAPHALDVRHGLSPGARASVAEFDRALDALIARILEEGRDEGTFRADLDCAVDTVLVRYLLEGMSALIAEAPDRSAEITSASTRTILTALR